MVVVDYSELTVDQFETLRVQLLDCGAGVHVTKNSYAKRAAAAVDLPQEIAEFLSGQTALVTGEQDICATAKVLKEFRKQNEKLEMRAGVLDGNLLSSDELNALAALPPMDILRAQLLGTLQSPASTFVRLLNEPASGLARVLRLKGEQG